MKTKAAVLRGVGQDFEITELDLDPPKAGEVLIRYVAAGLCHSDEHLRHGDIVPRFPIVGGHEGAGIIEEVGAGVTRLKPGDHVICSFLPVCGHCRWCSTGKSNLCDLGATILDGVLPDGTYRFHENGEDLGGMCMLGTFSEYSTISENSAIKVDSDLPLDKVVLIGCGVPTGFGSAVHAAATEPGDTIAIYGIGGIGINSVQGAALAGARNVVAIDPLANKREAAEQLGATHSCETAEQAQELITQLTRGVGADKAIVTVGVVTSEVVTNAFNAIRKGGTVVVTGLADPIEEHHRAARRDPDPVREAHPGQPVRLRRPVRRHPAHGRAVPVRGPEAGRADHVHLHPGPGQPGLPGPDRRQEHPRRHPV